MQSHDYPILEYDPSPTAFIDPVARHPKHAAMPEHVVLCFFYEVLAKACAAAEIVLHLRSELGANPVYVLETEGRRVAVAHPGVGAPLAATFLDELIAYGGRKFIAVGGAGALNPELVVGHAVIPTAAVRDEGTSYHYLPPAREVEPSPEAVEAIRAALDHHHVPHVQGKTWTTDGLYRETPARIARRRAEGCLTVEMEASAFFAVAQFRGVTFGQLLYGGDDLSGDVWDHRDWISGQASTREKLFLLAQEACLRL